MSCAEPFSSVVLSEAALRELYREPSVVAASKSRSSIDAATAAFIGRATFAVIGTHDAEGRADVSPRGGPAGFVRVLDEHRLVIADLSGNNRLDCLRNIVQTRRIGALLVVTGHDETVRVNGRAFVTTDPEILDGFPTELRRPTSAIGIRVEETFVHCAKSLRRAGLWDPATWDLDGSAPDAAAILACQRVLDDVPDADIRASLEQSYATSAETDRTGPR